MTRTKRTRSTPLIPRAGLGAGFGATLWVLAALSGLAGAAVAGAHAAAESWATGLERRLSVALVDADAASIERALDLISNAPGVLAARLVPEGDIRAAAVRWIGSDALLEDFAPRIIDVALESGDGAQADALRARLTDGGVDAVVSDHRRFQTDAARFLDVVRRGAIIAGLGLAVAAGALAAFSAGAAVAAHRSTVELLETMGAPPSFVAREVLRGHLLAAGPAALAGAIIALAAVGVVTRGFGGEYANAAFHGTSAPPSVWAACLIGPILIAGVSTAAGRWTVHRIRRRAHGHADFSGRP